MSEEPDLMSSLPAREYLRLFRQEGRSLAGLVLLEIGWVLLLLLASKLAAGAGGTAAEHGAPGRAVLWSVPLNFLEVWAIGSLAILFLWLLYSGLLNQVVRIAYTPLRPLVHFLFTIVVIVIGLLDAIVSFILRTARNIAMPDPIKAHQGRWIAEKRKEEPQLSAEEANAAYDRWVADLKAKNGEGALEELIQKQERFDPFAAVWRLWQLVGTHILAPTQSSVRIGLAVPIIHSQTGGQRVQPEPFPNLLRAYASAKSRTKRLPVMRDVRMMILPLVVPISNHERARLWARLLSLDMLIWCDAPLSHMEPAHVFLQKSPERTNSTPEDDRFGNEYQRSLFPSNSNELRIDPQAFSLAMTDQLGAYAGFLVAVALAICRRRRRSLIHWLKTWDRTFDFADQRVSELVEHLAFEVLPRLSLDDQDETTAPSIRWQIAGLIGSWVGRHMREDALTRAQWQRHGETRFGQQLMRILEACVRLAPERPENWFRMGALACFLENRDVALEAFHRASERAQRRLEIKPTGALVIADDVVKGEAKTGVGRAERLAWGRFAAHAACALAVGGDWETKGIRELLASDWVLLARHSNRSTAIGVMDTLVAENSQTMPDAAPKTALLDTTDLEAAS